jgi:uncharacterized protein
MRIEVGRIAPDGERVAGTDDIVILEPNVDGQVSVDGPLKYDLFVQLVDNELIISGKVAAKVAFRCARCGEQFKREVADNAFSVVQEVFDKGESADLTGEMREAILCAFPSHPVCNPKCKGLCANCGANLNKGKCDCKPAGGFKWEALDGLKL